MHHLLGHSCQKVRFGRNCKNINNSRGVAGVGEGEITQGDETRRESKFESKTCQNLTCLSFSINPIKKRHKFSQQMAAHVEKRHKNKLIYVKSVHEHKRTENKIKIVSPVSKMF